MAILEAIGKLLQFMQWLTTIMLVEHDSDGDEWHNNPCSTHTMPCFPMFRITSQHDDVLSKRFSRSAYKREWNFYLLRTIAEFLSEYLHYLFKQNTQNTMTDNLRRAMQDIDLGSEDAPFVLPPEVVRQAAAENRFILIGRPSMPRRQNLRNLVATMPRVWGLEGLARGRVIEGRRFQFFFPSEEAMDTVVRRGPWAYADRMIVLQRWTPLMDMALLNFIPFWIQVRGIPLQYMNREVILHIARAMGHQYIQMEYNEETGGQMEFVRFRLNWDITQPLKFQRNFQFTPGINTLLRFQYERLRGFCEVCGLITHDSGRLKLVGFLEIIEVNTVAQAKPLGIELTTLLRVNYKVF
ncbi:PREDICTED: uncharacterized protein LOC106329810 [Brassica oleracea var. oleracea]|uniref:uncharacterized protein LOC106329810 n=1 Tax=Brassica oleracea var. oleracea TaxID=109376 RepID=UPI0006A751A9|nr:PREDICTED: uncharacterized protein LOC106329810 [Brassica oleracea var. oleracea]